MGWASGTGLFDAVVEATLKLLDNDDPEVIQTVVDAMYGPFAESDWDTEEESEFYIPYLLETLHNLGYVDDEYYESVQFDL